MLEVTSSALNQLHELLGIKSTFQHNLSFDLSQEAPNDIKKFRLGLIGGGCAGFQYSFGWEAVKKEEDLILNNPASSLEILINKKAQDFVKGSTLDYIIALGKRHFTVKNPNATSSCGCGSSFSI
jgi:iron-sulfur cluster assembly accessory protein